MSASRPRRAILSADLQMNMTPMIDIVFLLIIFFMVATTFSRVENDPAIQLPDADAARDDLRGPTTVVVNVRANGDVRIGERLYTQAELPRVFREMAAESRRRIVVVRADARCRHEYFIQTLQACARAGLLDVRVAARRVKANAK